MKTSKSLKDSQQEISTLKQTIVRLEATNKSNVEEKQKILTKLDLVLKDLANRKDDNSAYDKKITTGFSEIASLRAQSESLQAKMLEAEIVASNLQKEKEALSAENKKIIEEAETLAAELFILKKRFSEEGNQLSTLMQHTEKELAVKIAEIATLKSQIARLEEDKARLSKQLDLAKTRLLDDCTKLHEETLELQQKLENAERRLQGAEQQVERSKSELHDNSSKIESLVSHQNDLKLENNRKEQDIIALQEQVESLLKEKLTQSEIISAREKQLLEKTKSLEEKSRESNMNLTLSRRKEMNGDGKGGSNNNRELEIVKVLLKSINAEVLDILNMEKISARNIDDNLYLSNPNLTTSANGDNTKAVIEIIIENLMKVKKQSMDRKVASEVAAEERQQKIQFREMYKNASRRLSVLEVEVDAMRTSQTIRNDAPPNLEVALDKEEIETELEAIQAIENIVSNLTNTNTMIVVESKEEMLQTLSDKVAGIKKHTVLRRNTNNTASAEHQTNVKLTRDLTEAKEEISNLQAEIIVLKTSAATSSSSGYASEPIYDYSQVKRQEKNRPLLI